jgi:hypothetical protein
MFPLRPLLNSRQIHVPLHMNYVSSEYSIFQIKSLGFHILVVEFVGPYIGYIHMFSIFLHVHSNYYVYLQIFRPYGLVKIQYS